MSLTAKNGPQLVGISGVLDFDPLPTWPRTSLSYVSLHGSFECLLRSNAADSHSFGQPKLPLPGKALKVASRIWYMHCLFWLALIQQFTHSISRCCREYWNIRINEQIIWLADTFSPRAKMVYGRLWLNLSMAIIFKLATLALIQALPWWCCSPNESNVQG